ncbi:MAG: CoB--CoM heterodisulfide reductase iron-sulfur subunit B family protein [Candidatus Hydrothermarchaeales archaeon]
MDFSYFPGCTLHSSSEEYDISTKAVSKVLGVNLIELEDWNCCGAMALTSIDKTLAYAFPARNLAIAEKRELELVTPCSACFYNFKKTSYILKEDEEARRGVNETLAKTGLKYLGKIEAHHLLDVIVNKVGFEAVAQKVVNPLMGLNVVPYYGCLLVRPPKFVNFDDPERPTTLDGLISTIGANPVPFDLKTICCGGPILLTQKPIASELSGKILIKAKDLGADCIVLPCPLCHMSLDAMQRNIEAAFKVKLNLPILFFTQLLGLALGLKPSELALNRNVVNTKAVMKKIA